MKLNNGNPIQMKTIIKINSKYQQLQKHVNSYLNTYKLYLPNRFVQHILNLKYTTDDYNKI